jgi:signal transduction histidine kinase
VLTNLVSNAAIFSSPRRAPFVSIEIRTHSGGATIVITDNGIGIRKDILPKVWNMFYRGNEASQGAGLGLYIVREAVSRLHGSITFRSEVDLGTSIRIEIPNLIQPQA